MRAAIYLRVSSEEQEAGFSLDGQEAQCRAYCDRQGYRVVRLLRDVGSGHDLDRPAFQRLIALGVRETFQVVVVWRRDRFARHAVGTGFFEALLETHGVRIESIENGPQENTKNTRLMRRVMDAFSEFERESTAERCQMGRETAAKAGEWPMKAPFGYAKIGKEDGRLVLEPKTANVMREAYAACLRGTSTEQIAASMSVTRTTAERRLHSPVYKGELEYNGVRVPCPALVSPETWQAAQDAIQWRRLNSLRHGPIPTAYSTSGNATSDPTPTPATPSGTSGNRGT